MRVILTAGGTGGHIYPALSIAETLSSRGGIQILYVGTADGLEAKLVPDAGLEFRTIVSKPLSRRLSLSLLSTVNAFRTGCKQTRQILNEFKPDVVVGFGGYVTGPVVFTAARTGVRTLIHEQNAMPGRANRLLSRWVTRVAVNFDEAARFFPEKKVVVVGMPVRGGLGQLDKGEAWQRLGLQPNLPTLLICGGSRGARTLNRAALDAAARLAENGIQILHQTGSVNFEEVKAQADSLALDNYHVVPYIEDIPAALSAADLGVTRSGASTVAELTVSGLPAILVPYPFAIADHQTCNARALVDRGAAILVPDSQLKGDRLVEEVLSLINNSERLRNMSAASKSLARADAAEKMAELIIGN